MHVRITTTTGIRVDGNIVADDGRTVTLCTTFGEPTFRLNHDVIADVEDLG